MDFLNPFTKNYFNLLDNYEANYEDIVTVIRNKCNISKRELNRESENDLLVSCDDENVDFHILESVVQQNPIPDSPTESKPPIGVNTIHVKKVTGKSKKKIFILPSKPAAASTVDDKSLKVRQQRNNIQTTKHQSNKVGSIVKNTSTIYYSDLSSSKSILNQNGTPHDYEQSIQLKHSPASSLSQHKLTDPEIKPSTIESKIRPVKAPVLLTTSDLLKRYTNPSYMVLKNPYNKTKMISPYNRSQYYAKNKVGSYVTTPSYKLYSTPTQPMSNQMYFVDHRSSSTIGYYGNMQNINSYQNQYYYYYNDSSQYLRQSGVQILPSIYSKQPAYMQTVPPSQPFYDKQDSNLGFYFNYPVRKNETANCYSHCKTTQCASFESNAQLSPPLSTSPKIIDKVVTNDNEIVAENEIIDDIQVKDLYPLFDEGGSEGYALSEVSESFTMSPTPYVSTSLPSADPIMPPSPVHVMLNENVLTSPETPKTPNNMKQNQPTNSPSPVIFTSAFAINRKKPVIEVKETVDIEADEPNGKKLNAKLRERKSLKVEIKEALYSPVAKTATEKDVCRPSSFTHSFPPSYLGIGKKKGMLGLRKKLKAVNTYDFDNQQCEICVIGSSAGSCIHIERRRINKPNPSSCHIMGLRKRPVGPYYASIASLLNHNTVNNNKVDSSNIEVDSNNNLVDSNNNDPTMDNNNNVNTEGTSENYAKETYNKEINSEAENSEKIDFNKALSIEIPISSSKTLDINERIQFMSENEFKLLKKASNKKQRKEKKQSQRVGTNLKATAVTKSKSKAGFEKEFWRRNSKERVVKYLSQLSAAPTECDIPEERARLEVKLNECLRRNYPIRIIVEKKSRRRHRSNTKPTSQHTLFKKLLLSLTSHKMCAGERRKQAHPKKIQTAPSLQSDVSLPVQDNKRKQICPQRIVPGPTESYTADCKTDVGNTKGKRKQACPKRFSGSRTEVYHVLQTKYGNYLVGNEV